MSENPTPEPSQDEVESLIDELEVHSIAPGGGTTDGCTSSCVCTIAC
ncbi:hypothetical protein [Planotetraspora sp. GP83]